MNKALCSLGSKAISEPKEQYHIEVSAAVCITCQKMGEGSYVLPGQSIKTLRLLEFVFYTILFILCYNYATKLLVYIKKMFIFLGAERHEQGLDEVPGKQEQCSATQR